MDGTLVQEILNSFINSIFDPNPVHFTYQHEKASRRMLKKLREPPDRVYELKPILNRNAFLCGCLDFTQDASIEYMIIGLGRKHQSTTKVQYLHFVSGSPNSVSFSPSGQQIIETHLKADFKNEILIFHNHPANWLNIAFDNLPIASSPDRKALLQIAYLKPLNAIKLLLKGGRIRFYLGENGFVREFLTPNLSQALFSMPS